MSLRELLFAQRRGEDALLTAEQALLDPEVRRTRPEIEELLHPDFSEMGSSGEIYGRETMIEMMLAQTPGKVVIRDFRSTFLSDDVALVTYRTVGAGGQEAHRSSVWVREMEQWRLRHHQGTRVPNRWDHIS